MNDPPKPRPVKQSVVLVLATVALGLLFRFAPLGLSPVVVKYSGSCLWALAIYWIASAALPLRSLRSAGLVAGTVATAVGLGKLYHAPALDRFRLTLPGILLLGRYFSWWDVLAYWIAIAAGALADMRLRPRT